PRAIDAGDPGRARRSGRRCARRPGARSRGHRPKRATTSLRRGAGPGGRVMEPSPAITGSRRLLRRLRDVMAGSGTAQERLNTIVRLIAGDMVAEVCSCYIMRAGEVLELFATEGLRPEAVHRTRLRVGEGLVGGR